ncbi:MAG: hypothetical protein JST86_11450 [Bacteroidetes bacterium]|nr:hypothetical protein [Bacteroidota bacterium]
MISIIVSTVFFGSMIMQLATGAKLFSVLKQLKDKNVKISRWSRYAAEKDLKHTLLTTDDKEIKDIAARALSLYKQNMRLFWGSIVLIILVFILNGIFKWQQ